MTLPLETTHELVRLSRAGDTSARDRLIRRYLPIISRWAHGRLPRAARDLSETADLVQLTLLRAFSNLDTFEVRGDGSFFAYLRQVMTNIVRDELRRMEVRPARVEMPVDLADSLPGPFAGTSTLQTLEAYERALLHLQPEQREAVVMRVELGLSHDEIAELQQLPSANAARMKVARALLRVAELMHEHRGG